MAKEKWILITPEILNYECMRAHTTQGHAAMGRPIMNIIVFFALPATDRSCRRSLAVSVVVFPLDQPHHLFGPLHLQKENPRA